MKVVVNRFFQNGKFTVGDVRLYPAPSDYASSWAAFTLEDPHNDPKIPGRTRIPEGEYDLALRPEGGKYAKYLSRFGEWQKPGMLWVKDVPGFEWILIHPGNTVDDTEGCLLVGLGVDTVSGVLYHSVDAYKALYAMISRELIQGKGVKISYVNSSPGRS